jgi:hypothetical protein
MFRGFGVREYIMKHTTPFVSILMILCWALCLSVYYLDAITNPKQPPSPCLSSSTAQQFKQPSREICRPAGRLVMP